MMMSEFVERTKYEPSCREYKEIEEAYYEFDGNKDDFCNYFKKELKSGRWEKEYQMRKQIRELKETLKQKENELTHLNDLACEYMGKYFDQKHKIDEMEVIFPNYSKINYTESACI